MTSVQKSSLRFIPRVDPTPWTRSPEGIIYPTIITDDVVVGAEVMVGDERFRVAGGVRIDDPTNDEAYLEMAEGDSAAVSPANSFRFRWNDAGTQAEISENGGAYVPFVGSSSSAGFIEVDGTAGENLVAGDLAGWENSGGSPRVFKADADAVAGSYRYNAVGYVKANATAGNPCTVYVAGEVTPSTWDAAPVAGDVGKQVYMSTTAGNSTLTAPGASGDHVQKVGILVTTTTVVIQIGDNVLLA